MIIGCWGEVSRTVTRKGWFSDVDRDAAPTDSHPWQPCLQLDGMCMSFDVWFATKQECDDFILMEVVGRPLLDSVPGVEETTDE